MVETRLEAHSYQELTCANITGQEFLFFVYSLVDGPFVFSH